MAYGNYKDQLSICDNGIKKANDRIAMIDYYRKLLTNLDHEKRELVGIINNTPPLERDYYYAQVRAIEKVAFHVTEEINKMFG